MNWLDIVIPIVTTAGGYALSKWKHGKTVKGIAKQILSSPNEPTTDSREALEQAVIRANTLYIERAARELDELIARGKLEARAAAERGKRAAEYVETTIVPPAE